LNNQASLVLEKLKEKNSSICHIYSPSGGIDKNMGQCSNYAFRGLICRLFGFGANSDKHGLLRLETCQIIKERQAENYTLAVGKINEGTYVPIFTEYYMNLAQIDFTLGNIIVPIIKHCKWP
jgi:uncharacterized protein